MLITAIITITLALIFYSVGVWGEKIQKRLKPWHVIIFWAGFVCDTTGTTLMSMMAQDGGGLTLHAVTGAVAILLMLFHALWATIVLIRKREKAMLTFHRLSLVVWVIWLIPYVSGMVVGMRV